MSAPVRGPQKFYSSRTPEQVKIENAISAKKVVSGKRLENDEKNEKKKNFKNTAVVTKIFEHRRLNDSCPIPKTKPISYNLNGYTKCESLNNQIAVRGKINKSLVSEKSKGKSKCPSDKGKAKCASGKEKEQRPPPPNFIIDVEPLETREVDSIMPPRKETNNEEKNEEPSIVEKHTVEQFDKRKHFCDNLLATKSFKTFLVCPAFKDPKYKPTNYTKKTWQENPSLNRFNDVFCIDSTRVILKRHLLDNKAVLNSNFSNTTPHCENVGRKKNDYIHANYVKIPNSDYMYICTQGPLQNTVEDFLLMCWQEDSKVIVMLCELEEDNTEKCSKYWPDFKETVTYGKIRVYNEREDARKYEGIVIRTLKVYLGDSRKVMIQYQLKSWPDHLVPPSSTILVTLLREVQLISSRNPIVVHCSAGIGRTGTFIGIHYASERFKNQTSGEITLMDVIKEIRTQRLQSVQSTIQYAYLNICLLEYFALDNIIEFEDNVKDFISKNIAFIQEYARRLLIKRNKMKIVKNKNTQD